jgi:hypothetical protein
MILGLAANSFQFIPNSVNVVLFVLSTIVGLLSLILLVIIGLFLRKLTNAENGKLFLGVFASLVTFGGISFAWYPFIFFTTMIIIWGLFFIIVFNTVART